MRWLLLIAAAGGAAPADVEHTATQLVSSLALPAHAGVEAEVAVAVGPGLEGPLGTALTARVLGRLRQLGLPEPRAVAARDLATAARRSRSAGAEWLLWVERTPRGDLVASLLEIEPDGLWGRAAALPPAAAVARLPWARPPPIGPPAVVAPPPPVGPPPPVDPPPATSPTVALTGPPLRGLDVPGRVLALAACPEPDGREAVAALTPDAVHVVSFEGGQLVRRRPVDLTSLPRASVPIRDPVGTLVCTKTALALGHGRLARGHRLPRGAASGAAIELPGLPVGLAPDGGLWLGRLAPGRNHFVPEVTRVDRFGRGVARAVWPPRQEASTGPGRPALAVTDDDALVRLIGGVETSTRTASAPLLRTGVGHSARNLGGVTVVVSTDPRAPPDRDTVRAWVLPEAGAAQALGPGAPVQGAVYASAFVRFAPGQTYAVVAAHRPTARATALYLWRLEEAAR